MTAEIDAFLSCPSLSVPLEQAPQHWRRSVLTVMCQRPTQFEGGTWFVAAVRGAWGHRLMELARETGDETLVTRLFRNNLEASTGRTFPPPYTLAVGEFGNHLTITLALHGVADAWRRQAFDALGIALETGIAVRPLRRGARRSLAILDAQWSRTETVAVPRPTGSARLVFHTPVRLGPRHALRAHWPDLVVGLADRVARMARWQGVGLVEDLAAWRRLAERLRFHDNAMIVEGWGRRSGAQAGRYIPMAGFRGHLDIANASQDLLVLLALGQHTHVGTHTTLGLGRYELLC